MSCLCKSQSDNDSLRALNFGYNVLNLVSEVWTGSTLKAAYMWLADGTKLGVRNASASDGSKHVSSLIYRKSSSGLQLTEALFGDGVIRVNDNGTVLYGKSLLLSSL